MGIRQLTNIGPPLQKKDIEDLEGKLDARLPAAYKRFLLKHNGGRPEPAFFLRNVLSRFYGHKAVGSMDNLLANRRRMKKWLPDGAIPIADDEFGNEICLAIKGKNRGKVYFWDHEGASPRIDPRIEFPWLDLGDDFEFKGDDWPGHPDLTLIADSFDEFLQSFHEARDMDEEVEDEEAALEKPTGKKPPAKKPASRKKTPSRKRTSGAARPRKKR